MVTQPTIDCLRCRKPDFGAHERKPDATNTPRVRSGTLAMVERRALYRNDLTSSVCSELPLHFARRAVARNQSADAEAPPTVLLPPVGIVARRSSDFRAVEDPLVRRALRFIDENLHRPISLNAMADATNVSRRTLTNRFRDKLHRTVAFGHNQSGEPGGVSPMALTL
jgi:hypothetical protein